MCWRHTRGFKSTVPGAVCTAARFKKMVQQNGFGGLAHTTPVAGCECICVGYRG